MRRRATLPAEPRPSPLVRAIAGLHWVEDAVLALLLLSMIIIASAQIFLRNLFDTSIVWGDPLLRMLVLWLGLLGALAASRGDRHISVDVLSRVLTGRVRSVAQAVATAFTVGVCTLLAWHAGRFVAFDREAGVVAVASLPAWISELVMPFAFGLIAVRYALLTLGHVRCAIAGGEDT